MLDSLCKQSRNDCKSVTKINTLSNNNIGKKRIHKEAVAAETTEQN